MQPGSMREGVLLDFATREELQTLKQSFYEKRNYGGAESWADKKFIPVWLALNELPQVQALLRQRALTGRI